MLVGLSGKARSGKDTVGDYLVLNGFVKLAFAAPLKSAIKTMFCLTDEHMDGDLKEVVIPSLGKSPRQLMQTLGTEWGRKYYVF